MINNSRTNKPEVDRKYNTNMVSLKKLFEQDDVISVNVTYTKENEKMINEAILKNIKDNAIIVNTARQELIDKEYLYSILEKGKINAVAPGLIDTTLTESLGNDPSWTTDYSIIKRVGKPNEIADAVEFLLSNKSTFITGQVLVVDGGFTLK